jgi:hypothetical protein
VQIFGIGRGSATITLTATLRQFSASSTTIAVVVSDSPSQGMTPGTGGSSTTTNTTTNPGAGGGDNTVVARPTDYAQAAPENQGQDDSGEDVVIEMGGRVARLTPLRADTDVIAKLREVAGTNERLTFWYGGTIDRPDYSWTFSGEALSNSVLDTFDALDLMISVSERGNGLVATLLKGTSKTLVLDFAFEGTLPAPATLYVAAQAGMAPEDALDLYIYDAQANGFRHVLKGLAVQSGYIAFEIDHCSIWAISAENLARVASAEPPVPESAGQAPPLSRTLFGLMPVIFVFVGVVIVFAGAIVIHNTRRRRALLGAAEAPVPPEAAEAPLSPEKDPVDAGV